MTNTEQVVIYFIVAGKRRYVTSQTTRPDNKYIVETDTDITKGQVFSPVEAEAYIKKVFNPFERQFLTEPPAPNLVIVVDEPPGLGFTKANAKKLMEKLDSKIRK